MPFGHPSHASENSAAKPRNLVGLTHRFVKYLVDRLLALLLLASDWIGGMGQTVLRRGSIATWRDITSWSTVG